MDDIDIICATNDSVCQEILKNFLTSFQKDDLLQNVQEKNEKEIVLSKSSIFVFLDSPAISENINTTLNNVNPNEYSIMIIIATHGQKDENRCIPCFTVQSKRGMWCSIWATEDKTFPSTEENMNANVMLDCFLKMTNIHHDKIRKIPNEQYIPRTSHTEERGEHQRVQPMGTETVVMKEIFDGVDNSVLVACSKKSEPYFDRFSKFMETRIGVSTPLKRHSKSKPLLALCLQHDGTEREIQELYSVTGRSATLIIITTCEVGVPLPPMQSMVGKSFSDVFRLRYSDSSETMYDCPENGSTKEKLKNIFPKHRKSFQFPWPELASSKKVKVETLQDSSNIFRKDTKLSTTVQNPGAQMKSSEHSSSFNDLVILCNRKVTVCQKVLMDFKNRYSISNELQWVSNAQGVRDVKKRVLVCLKISRLTDDITDAIKMVDLSDAESIFLVIIHTVEPGIDVDTSFLSRDSGIEDVAHIVYSENCGCYDCPENKSAISKLSSWFKS